MCFITDSHSVFLYGFRKTKTSHAGLDLTKTKKKKRRGERHIKETYMADSDEEPVAPRRPQPKPKPRSRMGAKQSTMASPDGTPSSSTTNSSSTLNGSTSPNRHTRIRVIEDDFFSKAKSYRPPKREGNKRQQLHQTGSERTSLSGGEHDKVVFVSEF